MPSTRTSSKKAIAAAVAAAVGIAGTLVWVTSRGSSEADARALAFWPALWGMVDEIDPPHSVNELVTESDAVVVARVTSVRPGRVLGRYPEPSRSDPESPPDRNVFIELSVDRVVKGAVAEKQVLTLDYHGSAHLLGALREPSPDERLLFFLRDELQPWQHQPDDVATRGLERWLWTPMGNNAIVAANANGLYLAVRPHEPDSAFLASFEATTVEQAADRAAQAAREGAVIR